MVYRYKDIIKNDVYNYGINLINYASELYGINFDFGCEKYKKFLNDMWSTYKYKQEIYNYKQEMKDILDYAIATNMEKNKKIVTIVDLIDSIYEIKTNSVKDEKIVNMALYKVKSIQEAKRHDR